MIAEVPRIRQTIERFGNRFLDRIFTPGEIRYCDAKANRFERYAARTGRDLTHIRYHEVLGIFKLAVILQQIYYRFHVGQTQDERFRTFDRRVHGLVRQALWLIEKESH